MSSKVCSLCGARQIILSSIEEQRLEREFELYSDEKDGRARIVDPPRYEEVGISGFPIMVIF